MQSIWIDVEIQKTRKADKITPAYSPDQSETESPGKWTQFFFVTEIQEKGGKIQKFKSFSYLNKNNARWYKIVFINEGCAAFKAK